MVDFDCRFGYLIKDWDHDRIKFDCDKIDTSIAVLDILNSLTGLAGSAFRSGGWGEVRWGGVRRLVNITP